MSSRISSFSSYSSVSSRRPSSNPYATPTGYDVFLNFHGKDTRHKFVSHLYNALNRHGVRTYKDDPELRSGEVISSALVQAIKKSKTYIVVLSENYASSPWCLDELVEILNCHKTVERSVIPVFYNIKPSVGRHQMETFEKAFIKHNARFETEKVDNWRRVLKEVANFSGKHISENSSEADILDEIVDEILLEINPKTLKVADYPVGLNSRVEDIIRLLSSGTRGMIKFGIYGMGGVGKTTLAKAVYNKLLRQGSFKNSCFLADVREVSGKTKGLVSLQEQLINDVLGSKKKIEVHNVEQGMKFISDRICSGKLLVLIDDIHEYEQFQSLVGPFGYGSLVVITTRDEEILDKIRVDPRNRYRVNELDDRESLKLFNKYAFVNGGGDETLEVLSKDILRLAGGLPMAIKIFGSYLSTKPSEEGWKAYIEKLQRNPNSTIQQKLLISLDAVESDDHMLKKVFLDVACFFIGRKREEVVKILETYYSLPDQSIDILKKRSLLTINDKNELRMHSLLWDMAKEVSRNNYPDEPGKHTRLWVLNDICHVLKNCKGTKAIEGINYHEFEYEDASKKLTFPVETFERMSRLRFLHLQGVSLTGSFERTFKDLRWLCWDWYPLEYFPPDFYSEKLVILELPHSKIIYMQDLNTVLNTLKTLNMSDSVGLRTTPDFTKLPCLETLNLKGCKSLEKVHFPVGSLVRLVSLNLTGCVKLRHFSVGSLVSLVSLNLTGCVKLIRLPDVCNLTALETLSIDYCSNMETLPREFGNINSLKVLSAEGLTLPKLPNSIGGLSNLIKLNLMDNKNLQTLPDTVGNLTSLQILDISGCGKLEILPDQLWFLTGLTEINAGGATMLRKLPDIKPSQIALSLQMLDLHECDLTALPSGISRLSNLEDLDLTDCVHLLSITELPPNLKCIAAVGCMSMQRLLNLSNMKQLEELDLTDCSGLTEIQGLKELTSIRVLCLTGCKSSLLAYTFTRPLFQAYCKFGHSVQIYAAIAEFPDWISQFSNFRQKMSIDLPPNMSDDFLGMILCFKHLGDDLFQAAYHSVKNTRSTCIWRDSSELFYGETLMVIVPGSIFSVRDGASKFELTTTDAEISGTLLLYKT
ncbi:hypothetical protein AgCh_039695 [Apium graveolens]